MGYSVNKAEYEVCKRRGHERSTFTMTSNPPQYVCKWCGMHFMTRVVVEEMFQVEQEKAPNA